MGTAASENELDSLASLEQRITHAVEVVSRLRGETGSLQDQLRAALAERDNARKEAAEASIQAQKLAQEIEELRSERKQVRTRIEKLLGQMDLLSPS